MVDTLKKVKPGDPLTFPATTFNTFVDSANDFLARRHDQFQGSRPSARHSGIVFVRNDSGADRSRFDVLGVSSPVFNPSSDEEAFKNQPALSGVAPTEADHFGKFVILLEPVATGEIGLAAASGACPVHLYIEDDTLDLADVSDGDPSSLKTSRTGSATILWRESGSSGTVWAVVRLGTPSIGTHDNPKVLGGSGVDADTEAWDVDDQEDGYDGVEFKPFRLYWSGTAGDPVYQFIRTPTYDSIGRLVLVSAEVRSVAFGTGNCQT